MGKRKERRLAAKIGAGRRVKLDLFAEPSGDLGGSSAIDEDGKDVDTKLDDELPNSPSSSGQPLENPLSLLGQYSDDDLDDGANEGATNSDDDKQAKHPVTPVSDPLEEGEIVGDEDQSSQKADKLDVDRDSSSASASFIAGADAERNNVVGLDEKDCEANIENQDHVPVVSDDKSSQGTSSTWKMVLHEDSNRYYYWNTVTGETSWDLPDGFAQGTSLINELEVATVNVNAPPAFGLPLEESSAIHGVGYTSEISDMKAIYEPGALVHQPLDQSEVDGSQFLGGYSVVGALPYEASSLGHYSLSAQTNPGVGNLTAGSHQGHDLSAFPREQGAVDYPSNLVKNGEALLERLKLLQGSGTDSAKHGLLSKYMLEIEIRLSDIRCLLPYGSSLVPFWMHSDRQLSQVENAINIEIGKHNNEVSVLQEGREANLKVEGDDSVSGVRKSSPGNSVSTVHDLDTSVTAQEVVHDESLDGSILNVHETSQQDPLVHQHNETNGDQKLGEVVVHEKSIPNAEVLPSEDMDMDVDMEVEDQCPTMNIGDQMVASSGQLVQPSALSAGIYQPPESEPIIPPPPEEEWIPPPPPDEEIPPPPPDEPPESLCPPPPPSELEPVPSIDSKQLRSASMEPIVNYYGNTITDPLGTGFYEHADASHFAAITPPAYYAAVSNVQPIPILNPTESVAYYGIPNGALPAPVPPTIGSSNLQSVSGQLNYDPLPSEHMGTVGEVVRTSSLSKQFMDPPPKTDIASIQVSSSSVASAPATVSTKEHASVPSYSATATSVPVTCTTSAAVSDATAAASKVQSKVSRVKKPKVAVASSLRSNKKVSSLVDKWKAAKEELQENEKEERETPLEILEKKKQREIEGWRAQQIASGEAKENANFQPLGGDWRERVKRKRAQKEAAAVTVSDTAENKTKQPDLGELSKGLPAGWQAVWDDSSRKVYYANLITSETTWIRPSR